MTYIELCLILYTPLALFIIVAAIAIIRNKRLNVSRSKAIIIIIAGGLLYTLLAESIINYLEEDRLAKHIPVFYQEIALNQALSGGVDVDICLVEDAGLMRNRVFIGLKDDNIKGKERNEKLKILTGSNISHSRMKSLVSGMIEMRHLKTNQISRFYIVGKRTDRPGVPGVYLSPEGKGIVKFLESGSYKVTVKLKIDYPKDRSVDISDYNLVYQAAFFNKITSGSLYDVFGKCPRIEG